MRFKGRRKTQPRSKNRDAASVNPSKLTAVLAQLTGKPIPKAPEAQLIKLQDYQTFWDFLRIQQNLYQRDISDFDKSEPC